MAADNMAADSPPFWERLSLDKMSEEQWESLCDGCGRCCLQKLEDADTHEVWFTRVACHQLNEATGRCRDYGRRFDNVPDCLAVRPLTAEKSNWLPDSCAYRRLNEGKSLENWHPLISGRAESVKEAGICVAGRCISETKVPISHYSHYLFDWKDVPEGEAEGLD
ncbi:unnamed protein product [Cyprideis torosa]|uniref:Uncharacterized protein n=1 Tax=Cyprideis torosa TaxID=163714 RepID=A0A7R9A189_9CRUS|nr:unnamed protein product [Cyprideis torosa]CAG0911590.1 unnamed protein product [Cyprideis torosa]